jgi:hypothetical protein
MARREMENETPEAVQASETATIGDRLKVQEGIENERIQK